MNNHNHNPQNNQREKEIAYTCPMHPNVRKDKPGMCPECGMALVPVKEKGDKRAGHEDFDKHSGHSVNIFKAKFWVSFILSIPIVAYSDIAEKLLGYMAPGFLARNTFHSFSPQLFSFMVVRFL